MGRDGRSVEDRIGQHQRLSNAHGSPVGKAERKARNSASAWRPNPRLETLIRLRGSDDPADRARFDAAISATTRMTLHRYEVAKRNAAEHGVDVTGGDTA